MSFRFQATDHRANRHKMALLTWAVVYPLTTVLLALLEPLISDMAMPLRTLILSVIMVPAMAYVALPRAVRAAHAWLHTPRTRGPIRAVRRSTAARIFADAARPSACTMCIGSGGGAKSWSKGSTVPSRIASVT